jgi:hypothetical protein
MGVPPAASVPNSRMFDAIKAKLPQPVFRLMRDGRDFIKRSPEIPSAYLHAWRRESIRSIRNFRDKYQGKRCFIIGNGPSLRNMDLKKLKNEFTFGMNRIYLAFPEMGFQTSFFVSINDLVIQQTAADILDLKMPKFVSWRSHQWLQQAPDLFFLYTTYTEPVFARNAAGRLWEGATVTYTALQLAHFFGFTEVILIGVDHNFATKGKPNETVTSSGDDPNHFNPAYFGKGFRWQLPDLETSEMAYRMAKDAFEKDGRQVLDATVEGKLNIFPKVEYERLF